jgi:hypothetical protein
MIPVPQEKKAPLTRIGCQNLAAVGAKLMCQSGPNIGPGVNDKDPPRPASGALDARRPTYSCARLTRGTVNPVELPK